MKALSARNDDPMGASRPWDKDRDGFVLSDGAAVLILESEEHAKNDAKILAEISGYVLRCLSHDPARTNWKWCNDRNGERCSKCEY